MSVIPQNENVKNVLGFTENTMKWKSQNVLQHEIEKLGSVKVRFRLDVHLKCERQGENGEMVEEKQTLFQNRSITRLHERELPRNLQRKIQ